MFLARPPLCDFAGFMMLYLHLLLGCGILPSMQLMKSSNPTLKNDTFTRVGIDTVQPMTISGTVDKTGICLALVIVGAILSWSQPFEAAPGFVMLGGIAGFVSAIVLTFKKQWAPVLAPLYSFVQGLALGAISSLFEAQFPGIVIQAVGITFATLFGLLAAYKSGLIRATENFKLGVFAATAGIALFYLVTMILGFFGVSVGLFAGNGLFGIGFSLFVCAIAALNLVMDFDFIEQGAAHGAPKYMEWYGAFGLMVTLIWLYLEVLRLLAKLNSRRD